MRHILLFLALGAAPAAAQTTLVPGRPAGTTPSERHADYQLGPQDTVKVTVFDEPNLSGSYRIDADGTFTYPLLERVKAAGRTTADVRVEIQKRLAEFVQRPSVTVEVDQFRTRRVSVVGQVRSPGPITLVGQMTVLEALAQAGYVTADAGSELQVLHEGDSPNSKGETTRIQLAELQSNKPGTNIVLREGDMVIVDRAQKFTVSGLVRNPNQYTWERGTTVRVALALAGGLADKGSNRGIVVHRMVGGKPTRTNIGMDDLVEPNDIIEIRQRRL